MQCFDTFHGFLHKLYAVIMDWKGREGTYNCFSRQLGAAGGGGQGRAQGQLPPLPATPVAPPMRIDCSSPDFVLS